ncbi:hypothetical protein [Aliikangiella sp. IMCC44359]|uniref:hypothetical protein n=1 Tax=Aliikangiella sp. IMCC44359 TaxID=3459125 RepID=UPI00403B276E
MNMLVSCDCKNIEVIWNNTDNRLVPRACQCDYCLSKSAVYVTNPKSSFEAWIRNTNLHNTTQHGSKNAVFHECGRCEQIIFVTVEIDEKTWGALNANQLKNKHEFPDPVALSFSHQTAQQKRERWRQNWCHPVTIYNKKR